MFYSWWVSTQSRQSSEGGNTSWSRLTGPNTFWMRASLKGQFNKNTSAYFFTCLWWSFNCPATTQNELHSPPSYRCGGRNLWGRYFSAASAHLQIDTEKTPKLCEQLQWDRSENMFIFFCNSFERPLLFFPLFGLNQKCSESFFHQRHVPENISIFKMISERIFTAFCLISSYSGTYCISS